MTLMGGDGMEKEFESKVRLQNPTGSAAVERSRSFTFRAPQEQFTVQDFELGRIYGVGSYSKVVRARKKDSGNVYALKIMDKKFITKEKKASYVKLERIVLDQLDHPGIIRLFFTFQDNYSLYMGLESCEGGELFDQIMRKGSLSEAEAQFYAAEVIDALEYIHSVGLIHRDIKPENLLLTADGHIKIADFGSVKPMNDCQIKVIPTSANEKACSFVGTAAYVPPEVLNSSPAAFGCFAILASIICEDGGPAWVVTRYTVVLSKYDRIVNDLWALGCTLYQMLSGTTPFKDASEWLIFKRITARDLKFPDYFSAEARDLIDKLLDTEPTKRLGAGPNGYASLKMHPFFRGIDWKNLRGQSAPNLAPDPNTNEVDDDQDASWNLSHVGDGSQSCIGTDCSSGGTSTSESSSLSRIASIDSFDSRWQEFLDLGESIVMISMVKKIQKLTNKKVQLILTDKPKLIYVDPSKLILKGNIIWSDNPSDLSIQVTNSSLFKIITPKKVLTFEDAKQRAWQWKKAIEGLQNR